MHYAIILLVEFNDLKMKIALTRLATVYTTLKPEQTLGLPFIWLVGLN
jgi:hypothetical protein